MNKLLFCRYNMDTNRWKPGLRMAQLLPSTASPWRTSTAAPRHTAELDWLLYNKPLEYAQLVLGGEIERYRCLAATMADWKIDFLKSRCH